MNKFSPDIHWLTEYAAGNLPLSHSICVAAHLNFNSSSRAIVEKLDCVGSLFFSDESISDLSNSELSDSFKEKTLEKIFSSQLDSREKKHSTDTITQIDSSGVPNCLKKLIPNGFDKLKWKSFGKSLRISHLETGDSQREVALHRISPGAKIANHDHRGQEITVVLKGSFSDEDGLYMPGDFIVKKSGEKHKPIVSKDSECICLSVSDGPIKLTGFFARFLNPFLRLKTSG